MLEFLYFVIISSILSTRFLFPLFLIFIKIFGFQCYKESRLPMIQTILRVLPKNNSTIISNDENSGLMIGKWFICHEEEIFSDNGSRSILTIICTKDFYAKITNNGKVETIESQEITIWNRCGSYYNTCYTKKLFDMSSMIADDYQQSLLNKIIKIYESKNRATVYLYGESGYSKSTLCRLLAKHYKGHYCKTFNPCDPGNTLEQLHSIVGPEESKPLVIVFEEADILLKNIHNKTVELHKNLPTQVKDKSSYNSLMDDISVGIYPNTILIMTSNVDPTEIDNFDPSYLNGNRIDIRIKSERKH